MHKNILAGFLLCRIVTKLSHESNRMRSIYYYESLHVFRMTYCERPGYPTTPVMSYQDETFISKVLGKSIGAVRVIQYRALGALRRRLEDDFSHHFARSRAG